MKLIPATISKESLQSKLSILKRSVPNKLDKGIPVIISMTNIGISVCFIISQNKHIYPL